MKETETPRDMRRHGRGERPTDTPTGYAVSQPRTLDPSRRPDGRPVGWFRLGGCNAGRATVGPRVKVDSFPVLWEGGCEFGV